MYDYVARHFLGKVDISFHRVRIFTRAMIDARTIYVLSNSSIFTRRFALLAFFYLNIILRYRSVNVVAT